LNWIGNAVARITTMAVTAGRMPPGIAKNFVIYSPALQIANDTARAVAVCRTGSLLPDSDPLSIPEPARKYSTSQVQGMKAIIR
jgi:hypothetical protein